MDLKLKTVAVVLGTYNGELYLETQIESILQQKGVSVRVFARDDGSSDHTPDILIRYSKQYPNFHLMNNGKTINKGVRESFIETLKWALAYSDDIEFFAFSDQDDVWLPEKLVCAVEKIKNNYNNTGNGVMYYSNKTIVEENLEVRYTENFACYNDFYDFYFVSKAYGCTMVIDRRLAELSTQFVSEFSNFHDDWIHRLAICLRSEIVFDNNSYILYRQHKANQCGVFCTEDRKVMYLLKRTFDYILYGGGHNRSKLARDIIEHYGNLLDEDIKQKLVLIVNYKCNLKNKIMLIKNTNLQKRTKKDCRIWKAKVFLGYF